MKKTIFLTLSNRAVFRNLFFFPGCVFEKLCAYARKTGTLRIVVLIPHKDFSKYQSVLGADINDVCTLESVRVVPARKMAERIFYFLYPYLIYTGTTKLLATMAIRPDEPPAGGRRFYAPIKWLISRTFGKFNYIKKKIVPFLFEKIIRDRPFQELFKKYSPDLIFAAHLYGWFDAHLLRESVKQGTRTVGMPAGWDHLDKYFLPFHVDTLFAQSEEVKRSAMKHQVYTAQSISITGYPHFDFIVDPHIIDSRESIISRLGFPPGSRYIMYISGSAYCPDEPAIIEEILSWIEEGFFGKNMFLVVRPYSGGRSKDKEFDVEKFNRFEHDPRVRFFRDDLWGNVPGSVFFLNIIRYTNVLLGMYTTLILEAAVLDVPLLAAAFDGHRRLPLHRSIRRFEYMDHFQDVLKTGALPTAYDFDSLKKFMGDNVSNPSLFSAERAVLRQELCGPLDGKSSDRILEEVMKRIP